MSPPGGDATHPEHAPQRVEAGEGHRRKRGGNRGRESLNRRTVRQINQTAEERLAARLDAEPHPNVEYATTARLEDLFDERRVETAGTFREPFFGRTTSAPTLKAKR